MRAVVLDVADAAGNGQQRDDDRTGQREAAQAGQAYQSYVAAAIGIWLGLQAFVNIGVNMGLLPTKGLTLPLLSYGGSSMLVTLGWIGVLLRIHHDTQATGRVRVAPREARRR